MCLFLAKTGLIRGDDQTTGAFPNVRSVAVRVVLAGAAQDRRFSFAYGRHFCLWRFRCERHEAGGS